MKKKKIILIIILLILTLVLSGLLIYKNNKTEKETIVQTNERDETKEQIEITNEYINIRKETSSESEILGKVYKEEIYTILEKKSDEYYDWCLIETTNGIKGYIATKYEEDEYVKFLEIKEEDNTEE